MKISIVFAAFALISCRSNDVGHAIKQFTGEKYLKQTVARDFRIEIRYLPANFRLLTRDGVADSIEMSGKLIDSLKAANGPESGLVFHMRICPKDTAPDFSVEHDLIYGRANGFGAPQEAEKALQFGLKENIWLEMAGKKTPLAEYRMENSYGLSNGRDFILLFRKPEGMNGGKGAKATLVVDGVLPGMTRTRFDWYLPIGKNDDAT